MPPTWIEPPPKQKRTGCLGKGCVMLVTFLILLAVAFFIGGYVGVRYVVTSTAPKEIPQIETTEADQDAVRHRWEEFKVVPRSAPVEATTSTTGEPPPTPPPSSNRIELSATDINQLIAG